MPPGVGGVAGTGAGAGAAAGAGAGAEADAGASSLGSDRAEKVSRWTGCRGDPGKTSVRTGPGVSTAESSCDRSSPEADEESVRLVATDAEE